MCIRDRRETAWYLWHLDPGGLEETGALVSSLHRDEEVLTRLHVLERGLKRNPAAEGLRALRQEALLFLGVENQGDR